MVKTQHIIVWGIMACFRILGSCSGTEPMSGGHHTGKVAIDGNGVEL